MDLTSLIVTLIVGGIAGWLAGVLMKGKSFGLLGNIVVGVLGAFFGGFFFSLLGVSVAGVGIIGSIVKSTFGAVILLFLIGLIKK